MSQAQRLENLKNDPYLFDQGAHGCCGFAGTLMALLNDGEKGAAQVDGLHRVLTTNATYRRDDSILNGVKARVERRIAVFNSQTFGNKGIDNTRDEALDVKLSLALMLAFKYYLKRNRSPQQTAVAIVA